MLKTYKAMIWLDDDSPGKRVVILAGSLEEAKVKLEEEYGEGRVFDLQNEEDAATARQHQGDVA